MIPVRKRWGQHFLVSPATAERIADAARLAPGDTVIEVGPGEGALTRPLLARAGRLLAIEIDPMRADALSRELAAGALVARLPAGDLSAELAAGAPSARLAADDRVRVVCGDALAKPFGEWLADAGWNGPAVLAANLPYNVATPILLAAIEEPSAISRAVATVQKEVAQRFAARAGGAAYGYLSVRAAAFADARVLFDIPPGAFRPRPKVVSSVLELVPRARPLDPELRDRAVALASLGFRARRKTLANALAPAGPRAVWEEALEELGKDRRVRAEELSLEDFLALARMPHTDSPARRSAGA